jgi:hypothetical protein
LSAGEHQEADARLPQSLRRRQPIDRAGAQMNFHGLFEPWIAAMRDLHAAGNLPPS